MRNIIFFLTTLIILLGCASVSRYEKSNVVAFGEILNNTNEPQFYLLDINIENTDNSLLPEFLVLLSPEAKPILSTKLNPDYVSKYLPDFIPPPQWPQKWKDKAKLYNAYEGNGFYISFKNARLISFGACSNCGGAKYSPVIGKSDGNVFYKLPLNLDQLVEIFGDPDKLYKVGEVRYGR
jgi:hypothetical protein